MSQPAPGTDKAAYAPSRKRVSVLISGRGSNMMSLVARAQAADAAFDIVSVISNRPDAAGLSWAADRGIATTALDHKAYDSREAFDADLMKAIAETEPDLVACAGFMRRMTAPVVDAWSGAMLNIHPSLLPLFKGLNTHQRAIEAGMCLAGCTVHLVTPDVDCGEILGQAAVPVRTDDTPDTLSARVLMAEHQLYPAVLQLYAAGELTVQNGRRVLMNVTANKAASVLMSVPALINPATDPDAQVAIS